MGSRDRLRKGKNLSNKLEKELENIIKNDENLKKWNSIRKEQQMKKAIEEESEKNRYCKIVFETDVENEFFTRTHDRCLSSKLSYSTKKFFVCHPSRTIIKNFAG